MSADKKPIKQMFRDKFRDKSLNVAVALARSIALLALTVVLALACFRGASQDDRSGAPGEANARADAAQAQAIEATEQSQSAAEAAGTPAELALSEPDRAIVNETEPPPEVRDAQETAEQAQQSGDSERTEFLNARFQMERAQAMAPGDRGLPFTHILNDGSMFTLNPRIAWKVLEGQEINYVFSYRSTGIPLLSDQYAAGFQATQEKASRIYPMTFTSVAPAKTFNIREQIAQIEELHEREQIDCLSLEPAHSTAYTAITNKLIADGIPVFTVGVTTNGKEFRNYTQAPLQEGELAAELALTFMHDNDLDWKNFVVSSGAPATFWAQERMRGFEQEILREIPNANFITTYQNALQVGGGSYDSSITYNDYIRLLAETPDVDFIVNVDIGAEHANRAISDSGLVGEVFTLGWDVNPAQLEGIERGIQIAALDQRWSEQAGFGALACAELFANHRILPNTHTPLPIGRDQVSETLAELEPFLAEP